MNTEALRHGGGQSYFNHLMHQKFYDKQAGLDSSGNQRKYQFRGSHNTAKLRRHRQRTDFVRNHIGR